MVPKTCWVPATLIVGTLAASPALGQSARQGIPIFAEAVPNITGAVVAMAAPPGDGERMFALKINGEVIVLSNGAPRSTPALTLGGSSSQGAGYGMAFDPDFAVNGYLYLSFPAVSQHEVFRVTVSQNDPNIFDPTTRTRILSVSAGGQHTSGWIGFGPDRMLYIAFGDAVGGFGTASHLVYSFGGKLLRIDPRSDQFPTRTDRNYAIPPGNPFPVLSNPPSNSPLPEIVAMGLRNPWKCSFDRANGDLYIGDVGQGRSEEINRIASGSSFPLNFGWPCFEGTATMQSPATCTSIVGHTPPIADLLRTTGSCITGGYVYRGAAMPLLRGRYVFASCTATSLYSVLPSSIAGSLAVHGSSGASVYCFGEDNQGELYLGTTNGIRRVRPGTPPTRDCNANLIDDRVEIQQCLALDVNRNNVPDTCERRCLADFDVSGSVDVQDVLAFVSAWFGTTICTDVNLDRTRGVQDLFEFLGAWFDRAGCE